MIDQREKAKRVLAVGASALDGAIALGEIMAADGMLILIEADRTRAEAAREQLEAIGLADRLTAVVGDPRRRLHKLSGPFDVILCAPEHLTFRERLDALLAPDGMFVCR